VRGGTGDAGGNRAEPATRLGLTGLVRGTCRYRKRRVEDPRLRMRLRELAEVRRRFGYRRLQVLLEREGWQVNHKRVYRLDQLKREGPGLYFLALFFWAAYDLRQGSPTKQQSHEPPRTAVVREMGFINP
jgi:HTH-like domain